MLVTVSSLQLSCSSASHEGFVAEAQPLSQECELCNDEVKPCDTSKGLYCEKSLFGGWPACIPRFGTRFCGLHCHVVGDKFLCD